MLPPLPMSSHPPNFDTAEYLAPAPATPLAPLVNATQDTSGDTGLLLRAVAAGLVGVVAGAVLYGGFIQLTHINIGYLAIVVAWLVAKAMLFGSGQRGGRPFQIAAVALTCLSVALGNAFMIGLDIHKRTGMHLSAYNLLQLFRVGLLEPFYELSDSPGSALLSLFILFIGLRASTLR